jgi:hypothetical protein
MSIPINKWVDKMKPNYLKISDIESLRKGEKLKLLCIDRNFYDLCDNSMVYTETNPEIPIKPTLFCKNNYIIDYIHCENIQGESHWKGIDTKYEYSAFNFHLNYFSHYWYPLDNNGFLPKKDPDGMMNFKDIELNYKNYDKSTLIGWRGPMLKWSDVEASTDLVTSYFTS